MKQLKKYKDNVKHAVRNIGSSEVSTMMSRFELKQDFGIDILQCLC